MKRPFIITLAILTLLFINVKSQAHDQNPSYYTTPQYFQPIPTPPPKPNFITPLRDSLWFGAYRWNLWNYNRFGRRLGLPSTTPTQPE
jgi:hypothetical protein